MTEKELKQFMKLLEKFIDFCDMDYFEALRKAQELKDIINEKN